MSDPASVLEPVNSPAIPVASDLPYWPRLEQAKKVSLWILRSLRDFEGDRRATAVMAMHDQVLEYHVGLVALAEHRIYGPAIALLRPMVEAYLRGVWLERLTTPDAIARFLTSDEPMDTGATLRVLRKSQRLGEAETIMAAWEASTLHRHPHLSPERLAATPVPGQLDGRFVPGLDEVMDALFLGTGVALLSTIKIAAIGGNPGLVQAAKFRLDILVPPAG